MIFVRRFTERVQTFLLGGILLATGRAAPGGAWPYWKCEPEHRKFWAFDSAAFPFINHETYTPWLDDPSYQERCHVQDSAAHLLSLVETAGILYAASPTTILSGDTRDHRLQALWRLIGPAYSEPNPVNAADLAGLR